MRSLFMLFILLSCGKVFAQDSLNIRFLGQYSPSNAVIRSVRVESDVVYTAREWIGMDAVDISAPPFFPRVSYLPAVGFVNDICLSEGRLYLACRSNGFKIYDRSDLENLVFLGGIDTPGTAYVLVEIDDVLYLADGNALRIYDVSNPALPQLLGQLLLPGNLLDLQVQPPFAFVSGFTGRFPYRGHHESRRPRCS